MFNIAKQNGPQYTWTQWLYRITIIINQISWRKILYFLNPHILKLIAPDPLIRNSHIFLIIMNPIPKSQPPVYKLMIFSNVVFLTFILNSQIFLCCQVFKVLFQFINQISILWEQGCSTGEIENKMQCINYTQNLM